MRFTFVLLCAFLAFHSLSAQTISGTFTGVKDGDKIWLCTNSDESSENKWSLSQRVDSCVVKDGRFEMRTPETSYGRIWLLRTKNELLESFFNKNEDFSVTGVTSPIGLLNAKISGGKEYALMNDIFSILESNYVTPIHRRNGVEWLKRHAAEDICPFATAYFYINRRELRFEDVNEIMSCIPQNKKQNPYYKILSNYLKTDSMIQPGKTMPELNLYTSSGQKIKKSSFKNTPYLVFSGLSSRNASIYIKKIESLIALQQSIPNLGIILVFPTFPKEDSDLLASKIKNKNILLADYHKTASANPTVFYDRDKFQNLILVNKDGVIIAVDPSSLDTPESLFKRELIKDGFTINGYVDGIDEGVVKLVTNRKGTVGVPEIIDSVQVQNGYFTFRGKLEYPQYCNIVISGALAPIGFFLENSSVDVNIIAENYYMTNNGNTIVKKSLTESVYRSRSEEDYKFLLNAQNADAIETWLSDHSSSIPALLCLASTWGDRFAPEVVERLLGKIDKSLINHPAYQETLNQIRLKKSLSVGNPAPNFTLPNVNNDQISLKDFKGNYVLIDFWASWCGPCREEIPRLKRIWDRHSKKNFEMISITIDKKRDDWMKALQAEKMPWTQLDSNNSDVADLYNVQAIPHILLINPDGNIQAIDLRGEKLEKLLDEILK